MKLYVLIDPRTAGVRYIGFTSRDLALRLAEHLAEAKTAVLSHRAKWIRALLRQGLEPSIALLRELEAGEDRCAAEVQAIAEARAAGSDLVNGTLGGEGVRGRKWKPNAAQRERMSRAHIGIRPTDATRQKRSRSLRRFYSENPIEMASRRALAAAAGKSEKSRALARERMKAIWSDPARAEQMRSAMRGSKAKKNAGHLLPDAR